MLFITAAYVIVHRTPSDWTGLAMAGRRTESDWTADGIRLDGGRNPMAKHDVSERESVY